MIGNVITECEANGVKVVFSNPEIITDKTWIEIPEKDIVKISYNVTVYSEKNEEKILDIKTSNFSAILNIPVLIKGILKNNFQDKTWQYLYESDGLTKLRRSVSTDKLVNEDFYEISRFVDVNGEPPPLIPGKPEIRWGLFYLYPKGIAVQQKRFQV